MVEQFHGAVLDRAVSLQSSAEAVYLRALLWGFNFRQIGATEIWEENASCIMMGRKSR